MTKRERARSEELNKKGDHVDKHPHSKNELPRKGVNCHDLGRGPQPYTGSAVLSCILLYRDRLLLSLVVSQ